MYNEPVCVLESQGSFVSLSLFYYNCTRSTAALHRRKGKSVSQKQKATASNVNCEYYLDLILFLCATYLMLDFCGSCSRVCKIIMATQLPKAYI